MASYHMRVNMISRSTGRSSVAAAAYRSGMCLTNDRDGLKHDYRNRKGVAHTEIVLPVGAADRFADRSELWNAVELKETRKNSQVAREVVVALPHELSDEARLSLVRDYVQGQFVDRGMIADIAIHAPTGEHSDDRNHHAHIMLTTRECDASGFTIKQRSWNDKGLLEHWRSEWADLQNNYLDRLGHDDRVDHRSLEVQCEEKLRAGFEAREAGDLEQAAALTSDAIKLNREAQPHIDLASYQIAQREADHPAHAILHRVREGFEGAFSKARQFTADIGTVLKDRGQDLVSRLEEAFSQMTDEDFKGLEKTDFGSTDLLVSNPSAQGRGHAMDPVKERNLSVGNEVHEVGVSEAARESGKQRVKERTRATPKISRGLDFSR